MKELILSILAGLFFIAFICLLIRASARDLNKKEFDIYEKEIKENEHP